MTWSTIKAQWHKAVAILALLLAGAPVATHRLGYSVPALIGPTSARPDAHVTSPGTTFFDTTTGLTHSSNGSAWTIVPPESEVSVKYYGAFGDSIMVAQCAITAGTNLLTCAPRGGGLFTVAMVGAHIVVGGAGAAGVALSTTVGSYVSPTQVHLAVNAASTVPVSGQYSDGPAQVWIHDDTTAIQNAIDSGQSIFLPPGVYAVAPNSLTITKYNAQLHGTKGYPQAHVGNVQDFYQPSQGAVLMATGAGTILSGPAWAPTNPLGNAALDLENTTISNLGFAWSSAADGVNGSIGLNYQGLLHARVSNNQFVLPRGAQSTGRYCTTWSDTVLHVAEACYYNVFEANVYRGDNTTGQRGIWWATNTANTCSGGSTSCDGGGVNGEVSRDEIFNSIKWPIVLQDTNGGLVTGADVEGVVASGADDVVLGDDGQSSGGQANGVFVDLSFNEGPYVVRFGTAGASQNVFGNHVHVSCCGNFSSGSAGLSAAAIVDPAGSNTAANVVEFLGAEHGIPRLIPWTERSNLGGEFAGLISGRPALRTHARPFSAGWADATAMGDFNGLLKMLRQNGASEPYSPGDEGNLIYWYESDYNLVGSGGISRSPGGKITVWGPVVGDVGLTMHGSATWQEAASNQSLLPGGFNVSGFSPNTLQPWIVVDGSSYYTATLGTSFTAGTIAAVVTMQSPTSVTQTIAEVEESGSTGGVRIYTDGSGNLVCQRRSHASAATSSATVAATQLLLQNSHWHLVACSFSNSGAHLIVDGNAAATDGAAITLPTMSLLAFGASVAGTSPFASVGGFGDLMIYSTNLSDGAIGNLEQRSFDLWGTP